VRATAWKRFLLCELLILTIALPFGEVARGIAYLVVSSMCIAAVALGARAWQPNDRWPWRAASTGVALFALAVVVRSIVDPEGTAELTVADVLDAAGYAACIATAALFLRKRSHGKDPTNLLDALIGVGGAAVLGWVFLVLPYLQDPTVGTLARARESVFIVEALVLALMIARLAIGPGSRSPSYYMLAVAAFGAVAVEVLVSMQLSGNGLSDIDLPVIVGPYSLTALGAAALHPSMRQLTVRATEPVASMTRGRLLMMGISVAVPPLVLLTNASTRLGPNDAVIIGSWCAIGVMVMVRLTGMLRARERAARVDQLLSRTAAGLVAATDPDEMYHTALVGTASLVGSGAPGYAAVLGLEGEAVVTLAGRGPGEMTARGPMPSSEYDPRLPAALGGHAPVVLHDWSAPAGQSWRDALVVPLIARNKSYGALVAMTAGPMDVDAVDAITSISSDLALALATAELAADTHRQRSERRFRSLIENADEIITVVDGNGRVNFVSPAVTRLLGYDEATVVGAHIDDIVFPGDVEVLQQRIQSASVRRSPMELRLLHSGGTVRWFEIVVADLQDEPEVEGIVITARDIADRKEAASKLAKSEARFRALVQHSADVVAVLDSGGVVRYVSSSVTRVLGYYIDDLLDHDIQSFVHRDDRPTLRSVIERPVAQPSLPHTAEIRFRDRQAAWRILDVTITDLRDDPTVDGIVLNAHDITARKILELDLRHQALHDELTALPNRLLLRDRIESALASKDDGVVAVLIIDLDDFKTINDAVGHPVGDRILQVFASRLLQHLRTADTAARLGGDEFAIVINGARTREEVLLIALRILNTVRAPVHMGGIEMSIEASVGVAFDGDCTDPTPEILLRNADMAMYSAKGKGKGRVSTYDESMHVNVFERLELKADLARAVEQDQLILHYQPIVDLRTGAVRGFEALMRWMHPERGLINPASFIPLAEETGMIVPMGSWLIDTALAQLAAWQAWFPEAEPLTISLNLSPRQLEDAELLDRLRNAIARHGVDPRTVTIEITESSVVDGGSIRHDRITEICSLGVNVVADDFGSGYASYAALGRLPFNGVKLDMSLIQGLEGDDDERTTAQVKAIIAMAASTGLSVVAEGVETAVQADVLRHLGCFLAQGYHFGRPVTADATRELLADALAASA
jgi:diguanylate cyclase (GGDEF)-like protein/PAS domain S-box-containing protein